MITHVYPFDVTVGAAATLRRWVGTITWTRDLTSQIVEMTVLATKTEGTSSNGVYVYWDPALPVELRPESEQYPPLDNADSSLQLDGLGYSYLYSAGNQINSSFRYVTGDPVHDVELPPTGSLLGDVNALVALTGVQVWPGYAPTEAALPYAVSRPLDVGHDDELAITGDAHDWNVQLSVYCCAASVEASFNLALAVIGTLQGARMRGTTLSATMGYNGAEVEGHYESQVTVQLNQGGF